MLNQPSPIIDIFKNQNLSHFSHCLVAIKKARLFASDIYYQQTLNEIRICAQLGYHRHICTMLGYVSTERYSCLILELAETNLLNVLKRSKQALLRGTETPIDIVEHLKMVAVHVAKGMVSVCVRTQSFVAHFTICLVIFGRQELCASRSVGAKCADSDRKSCNGMIQYSIPK
jgi:Protein tyrosine and serine/threonine kinase